MDFSKSLIQDSVSALCMAPVLGKLCIQGVSCLTTIPGFLDGYFGFCFMYLFPSPLSVFILGLYIHSHNFYISYYLLLTKPGLRCLYVLLLFTEVIQQWG
jgi:hypothetical protein